MAHISGYDPKITMIPENAIPVRVDYNMNNDDPMGLADATVTVEYAIRGPMDMGIMEAFGLCSPEPKQLTPEVLTGEPQRVTRGGSDVPPFPWSKFEEPLYWATVVGAVLGWFYVVQPWLEDLL